MRTDERPETDMERLRVAFGPDGPFRRRGYWARISQDGGLMAVPEDLIRRCGKFIFWHENETPLAFGPDQMLRRPLHMRHFVKHSEEIFEILADAEFFGPRVAIDRSPLGGVVIHPIDLEELDDVTQEGANVQQYVGKRYIIPTPLAREWYITAATAGQLRLVADDAEGTWMTIPWSTFTQQVLNESIKEVAA